MAEQSEDDQDKSEPATPRRIQKAREEGQVARSRELTTWLLLLAGVAALWTMGSSIYNQLALVMEQSFLFGRQEIFDTTVMVAGAADKGQHALLSLLPLFGLMVLVALGAPMLLGGWLISAKSLQPKLSKLNPIKGLKRVFSSQALAELGKVIAKALLVIGVVAWYLAVNIRDFMAMKEQSLQQALGNAMGQAALACGLMTLALIVVVLIDVPYQLWSHGKKLRMTKEEVKREHRESEGDPQVKQRIRSQQQAMARKRMMSMVPGADVIVTNPTHYAVALKYEETRMGAPRVVAKGADHVAEAIRELGRENSVPLLEAPPLARALYAHVDLDQEIPATLYSAVAEVLAWAFGLKRARKGEGELPTRPKNLPVPEEMDTTPHAAGAVA